MSAHQDLEPRVRIWLHERLADRPDPYPILVDVLSQLPETPQRKHRWWPFGRVPGPTTSTGRFTMSAALKSVAAGVVVALFGGFLVAGVLPTQQGDEALPAAVTESPSAGPASDPMPLEATVFDGRATETGLQLEVPTVTREDGVTKSVGAHYQMELTEMDDPRLNGTFQIVWNEVTFSGIHDVVTASNRIDNEDGSWVGVERGYNHPRRGWNWQGVYQGQGAYEGLSALLFWEQAIGYDGHGIIFPGTMPEPLDWPEALTVTE